MWSNTSGLGNNGPYGERPTITNSNIQDSPYPGEGNLSVDPQFSADRPPFSDPDTGNFQLLPTSPLINAGDPNSTIATVGQKDAAGQPRIIGGRVDIGAFEYQLPPAPTLTGVGITPNAICPGQVITFNTTVGNVSAPYPFTLTNGSQKLNGMAASPAFSQTLTAGAASPTGPQTYTLLVANNGQIGSATATVTIKSKPAPPTFRVSPSPTICAADGPIDVFFPGSQNPNPFSYSLTSASGLNNQSMALIPGGFGFLLSAVDQYTLVATA
ncbi:choice-of-anchor Q domain-containing protein, partial [Spirosoma spitsbergense]|uniref:choice-of-anchor Q domain-containing protein n=1 Tax=Spirosoma spitsbergense TaxID=431554 RepID=UPI0005AB5C95